jgi:hypothetical protein
MNDYQISYTEFEEVEGQKKLRRVVVSDGTAGRNGIEAIYTFLRARFAGDKDLLEALERDARTVGSIKRLTLGGITFQADKI